MRRLIALAFALALIPLLAYPCDRCGRSQCGPCCQQQTCTRPACDPCGESCDAGCAMPCACMEWESYCGCEMVTGLCISLTTDPCDGTAGPLHLLLRDGDYDEIVTIELAGPIEGYYTMLYEFAEPVRADTLIEAVLINDTDDAATLDWMQVYGMFDCCGGWTYMDHTCPGAVIGPGGCVRMVLF